MVHLFLLLLSLSLSAATAVDVNGDALRKSHATRRNVWLREIRKLDRTQPTIPFSRRKVAAASSTSTFSRFLKLQPSSTQTFYTGPSPSQCACETESEQSPEIRVVDFGADPTGHNLSDQAFQKAIAFMISSRSASGIKMADNITDLGGAVIQLDGGEYLISTPISFPDHIGNFKVVYGTIRAANNFPNDKFLIEIGENMNAAKASNKQKSTNENIGIEDIMLDGSGVAYGALQINATMGGNVGPDMFFINFNMRGLEVNGGHEVMLHESWFGNRYYSSPGKLKNNSGSIAVALNGNDHVVQDVIVFGSQVGLVSNGGANIVTGIHTWNDATLQGGTGIIVNASSTRLDMVYLDYNDCVIIDPLHASVTNSFFLGMGNLVIKSEITGIVNGLIVESNTWNNFNMPNNYTIVVDERNGPPFTKVTDFVMNGNIGSQTMQERGVTIGKSITSPMPTTQFLVNFTDDFLFPNIPIKDVIYSVRMNDDHDFVQHYLKGVDSHTVSVEMMTQVNATVYVKATQSKFYPGSYF
eukprot:m.65778 g.65778  ORF g.65778 m.65778 type:complete len:527 (+) comp11761_c0_seq1:96-1676(+)